MRADNVSRASRRRIPSRDGEGVSTHGKIRPALTDSKKVRHRIVYGPLVYGKSAACGTHGFSGRFAGDFETKKGSAENGGGTAPNEPRPIADSKKVRLLNLKGL